MNIIGNGRISTQFKLKLFRTSNRLKFGGLLIARKGKIMKHFLTKILSCVFVCIACTFGAIGSANAIDFPFSVTTTNLAAGTLFRFKITASGTFYVDCGNGGVLLSINNDVTGPINGVYTITRSDTTSKNAVYTCKYESVGGVKTIRFGGLATGYNSDTQTAAINFNPYDKTNYDMIASVSGNLSALFPYISGNAQDGAQPRFYQTFNKCTSLTSIPSTLFEDYTTGSRNMFYFAFSGCTGLTSLPSGLFSNFTTGATSVFQGTFDGCTGLTSIPSGLFSNITTGANLMFSVTFRGCTGLTGYIPPTLFAGLIARNVSTNVFNNTFINTGLSTSCPTGMGEYARIYTSAWGGKVSCEVMYDVDYTCGGHGSGTPSDSNSPYIADSTVTTLWDSECTAQTGYRFNGWNCNNNIGDVAFGETFTMPAADVTCTAQYELLHTMSLVAGTHGSGETYTATNILAGQTMTMPSATSVSITGQTGYRFNGWDCNNNIGDLAVGETFTMPAADVTCTAQWTNIYDVSYSCSSSCSISSTLSSALVGTSPDNYDLPDTDLFVLQWNNIGNVYVSTKCTDNGGTQLADSTPSNTSGQHCWYAVTAHESSDGSQCDVSQPSWRYIGDAGTQANCESLCAMNVLQLSFYSEYQAMLYNSVNTSGDGGGINGSGTAPSSTTATYNSSFTPAANTCTAPSGYMFSGWLVSGTNDVKTAGTAFTWNYAHDKTLNAQFVPKPTYTVTYDCGVGTGTAPSNSTAEYESSFTPAANTCTNSGYYFTGWEVSDTNDIKPASTAFTWTYNENKTLTAQWLPTYTVTYSCGDGGGNPPANETVGYNLSFTPTANTCTPPVGYSGFAGWQVSGTNDIKDAGTAFTWTYNGDKTLTAQWLPAYTVTYSCGTASGNPPSNGTAVYKESFTPEENTCTVTPGTSFGGWRVSGTNDTKPAGTAFTWRYNSDKTLTAQWSANSIDLTWFRDDGKTTINGPAQCTYGGTIASLPTAPTKPGYHFVRWKIKQASTSIWACSTPVSDVMSLVEDEPIYLYAKTYNSDPENGDVGIICVHEGPDGTDYGAAACSNNGFNDLNVHELKIGFSSGKVIKLTSSCNTTSYMLTENEISALESRFISEMEPLMSEAEPLISTYGENFYEAYAAGQMTSEDTALCESLMERVLVNEGMTGLLKMPASSFSAGGNGQYCWCKMVRYTPTSGPQCDSSSTTVWVQNINAEPLGETCSDECDGFCFESMLGDEVFMSTLFMTE